MALVVLSSKIGQTLKSGGHVVTHGGISDATVAGLSSVAGADLVILIDTTKFTTKNQVRSALREMFERAIANSAFTA